MKKLLCSLFVLYNTGTSLLAQQPVPQVFSGYQQFVDQVLADWDVQGAAVAVLNKDTIIYAQGFGQRSKSANLPVTFKTAFPIASIAKTFITLSIIQLKNEGKINIDASLNQYLNDIAFGDTYTQNNLSIKDLMLHRTGFARHEEIWHLSTLPRKALVAQWAKLTPEKPLRDEFQYSEMSYHLLCHLADQTAGTTWEQYVTQNVFVPLGFQHTSIGPTALTATEDYAKPTIELEEGTRQIKLRSIGTAGEVNSSVSDLAVFLRLFINKGRHKGRQLVPESSIAELTAPRIVVPGYQNRKGFNASYGYGWIIDNYRDHKITEHNGQTEGYSGWLSFLPDQGIGIVVLTNNDYSPVSTILKNNLLDRVLGLTPIDYNAELLKENTNGN